MFQNLFAQKTCIPFVIVIKLYGKRSLFLLSFFYSWWRQVKCVFQFDLNFSLNHYLSIKGKYINYINSRFIRVIFVTLSLYFKKNVLIQQHLEHIQETRELIKRTTAAANYPYVLQLNGNHTQLCTYVCTPCICMSIEAPYTGI